MVERACALHAKLDYAARVLVAQPNDRLVQDCARRAGFTVAVNANYARGIGTSASAGMAALLEVDDAADGVLFGVCDQPYLTVETVQLLMRRFFEDPSRIVAPEFGGKRGNPVLFPQALFSEFLALDGDIGGSAVLRAHSERLSLVPVARPAELYDIDTRATAADAATKWR